MSASPTMIAIGGGKGGVGKSVVSILLGQWLARFGKSTVLVDLDLGGANIHTLLGIKDPPASIHDLILRKTDSFEDIAISTQVEQLRVVCGASEILSAANPVFAQKLKIVRKLAEIDADYLILDLGAGTSFDVLDFFLLADLQVIVTTSEPVSIYNAYGFLRNAVYRRLTQLVREYPEWKSLIRSAMDPRNSFNIRTVRGLYDRLSEEADPDLLNTLSEETRKIRPAVIVNQVREPREQNTSRILQQVADRYLMVQVRDLGSVLYDPQIQAMVSRMVPLVSRNGIAGAFESMQQIATALMNGTNGTGRIATNGTSHVAQALERL
ncbi:MAG: P-loop NTPase [Acidobacteriota bacterium]|jgi:flagellar biosynthesis protein FlhG